MKIIAKTKDFYDHQANVWGVDNSIVYNRLGVGNVSKSFDGTTDIYDGMKIKHGRKYDVWFEREDGLFLQVSKAIMVCGKIFPIFDWERPPEEHLTLGRSFEFLHEPNGKYQFKGKSKASTVPWDPNADVFFCKWDEVCEDLAFLHRVTGHPVIKVYFDGGRYYASSARDITVSGDIPLLKDTPLVRHLDPMKLYQDISYWLSNRCKENPDVMPVGNPGQTNIEKIAAHGFDVKKSFRHRT